MVINSGAKLRTFAIIPYIWCFFLIPVSGLNAQNESFLSFDGKQLHLQSECLLTGKFPSGEDIPLTVKLTNDSDKVLLISSVRASCAVSIPSWPRQGIKSGEEGKIQIIIDGSIPKAIKRNLIIHANTDQPKSVFCIDIEIIPDSEITVIE